jgi:hypothetical protein
VFLFGCVGMHTKAVTKSKDAPDLSVKKKGRSETPAAFHQMRQVQCDPRKHSRARRWNAVLQLNFYKNNIS